MAALSDKMISSSRYYQNNFADGYKQDSLDLFHGNFKPKEQPNVYHHFHSTFRFVSYLSNSENRE